MLRRVPAREHAGVRTLSGQPPAAIAQLTSDYHADATQLRALLTSELARDIATLAGELAARFEDGAEITLHAHPDDLAALAVLDAAIPRVADATLTRGGFKIHGAAGELDATVETRIGRLLAAAEVTS